MGFQPGICRPGSREPQGPLSSKGLASDAGQCCSPSFCCVIAVGHWPTHSMEGRGGWFRSLHRPWGLKPHLTKDAPGLGSLSTYAPGSAMDLRSQRRWPRKLNLGLSTTTMCCARANPPLTLPSSFQARLGPDSFPSKPFYSRASLPFPGHWALM